MCECVSVLVCNYNNDLAKKNKSSEKLSDACILTLSMIKPQLTD